MPIERSVMAIEDAVVVAESLMFGARHIEDHGRPKSASASWQDIEIQAPCAIDRVHHRYLEVLSSLLVCLLSILCS